MHSNTITTTNAHERQLQQQQKEQKIQVRVFVKLEISVTRLVDFLMFLVTNFLTKEPKYSVNFLSKCKMLQLS